jgi:hypothetical protein
MKSLAHPVCQREIATRIAQLTPADRRQWGKMSVHQMICHVTEAYRIPLGDKQARPRTLPIPRAILKFAALRIPTHWPHGFPSPPEIAQDRHGIPPVEFEQDRAALFAALHDFCTRLSEPAPPHPYFGPMSAADWNRWGYLHADHHLRQFAR